MTDKQIEEIYAIIREAFAGGQSAIQMQSLPFRMTAENLAKHRLDPNIAFWRELKHGADHFEVTKLEPPVGVCNKLYAFATPRGGSRFDALSACPPLNEDTQVEQAVTTKERRDLTEVAALIAKGIKPIQLVYQDGGQNPAFANRFDDVSRPDALAPAEIVLDDGPKTRSALVQVNANALSGKLTDAAKAAPAPKLDAPTASETAAVPAMFSAAPSAYARGQ